MARLNVKEAPWKRHLIAIYSWFRYPDSTGCLNCKRAWEVCKAHEVNMGSEEQPDMGVYALCEECWSEFTIQQRLNACRHIWIMCYAKRDPWGARWYRIQRAVKEGK